MYDQPLIIYFFSRVQAYVIYNFFAYLMAFLEDEVGWGGWGKGGGAEGRGAVLWVGPAFTAHIACTRTALQLHTQPGYYPATIHCMHISI